MMKLKKSTAHYTIFVLYFFLSACSNNSSTLFEILDSDDTGINFNNFVEEDAENNVLNYGYFYNGGGVAAGDFNKDGFVDLYFTGNMVADKIYLNKGEKEGSKPKFEDITATSGIKHNGWKTGVTLVDINNDGWLDIYVCRSGAEDPALRKNLLYVNNGVIGTDRSKVTFTEKAAEFGLDDDSYSTQASFFDYDKDGDLDCFLVNHSTQEYAGFSTTIAQYRLQPDNRYGSKLLKNENNLFKDVSSEAGIVNNVLSFGLGINVSDFNQDGWLDVYISNDYNENDYLYINQKNGTFKESIRDFVGHTSLYSMGTDAADINNDGLTDLITLDMLPEKNERIKLSSGDDNYDKYQNLLKAGFHDQSMRNMLQINNGNGSFSELGQLAGISNTDWSWSALFADFDHDGLKDLFITNGYARDYTNMEFLKFSTDTQVASREGKEMPSSMEIIKAMPAINEPNFIFKNINGLQFEKKTEEWGLNRKSQSNGAIYADLDNDGDLDLVSNNINEKAFVYLNTSESKIDFGYLKVQLQSENDAQKIGAKVVLWQKGEAQYQEFQPTRGFQSAMYVPMVFGVRKAIKIDSVQVIWSNGKKIIEKNIQPNSLLTIKYSEQNTESLYDYDQKMFEESAILSFTHLQQPINDFKIQPLLPEMRSYSGPCIANGDINGDNKDDIFIGGGKGQSGIIYVQNPNGFSKKMYNAFEKDSEFQDEKAVFFDADGDKDLDLLVGSNGYSLTPENPLSAIRLYMNEKGSFQKSILFPKILLNMGAIATADYDKDGDEDIFLGGGNVSNNFPESQNSILLDNMGKGIFKENTTFKYNSLVSDALFTDINGDNYPDLFILNQWREPAIYINNKNKKFTLESTLNFSFLGHCIKEYDLDNDGDNDYIIGNEGLNTQYNVVSKNKLKMYAGDLGGIGSTVPLVVVSENNNEYPYASRDELLDQLPSLKKIYPDYISYSGATISKILSSEMMSESKVFTVNELRSGILWNENGKLSFSALPLEAQFSPIHAIEVKDLNKDGNVDIVIAGNTTQTRVRLGKIDANYGQVFMNQGNKKFQYLNQQKSGLTLKGDVRSLSFINQWLLCGINNQALKTYRIK